MKRAEPSHEYFWENYRVALQAQKIPLVYVRQKYDALSDSGLHLHEDHYALYVVNRGRGLHEINGHPYAIACGDVYIAPPGSIHAYRNGQNLEVDSFVFPIELLREEEIVALRSERGFRALFVTGEAWSTQWSSHRLHLAPEAWREIETRVREVCIELERIQAEYSPSCRDLSAGEILARVLFFRLLVELARRWDEDEKACEKKPDDTANHHSMDFAEVLRFCEARFAEPLSVPQLAAQMFLSPSRFAEIFKAETGAPPGEYLRRLRLDRAQTLLKTTRLSATEIADRCGFHDAAQFSRAFRRAFETSPSEYRKRFKT